MSNFDFNNASAVSGVSGVKSAADAQAQNKTNFDNAISTLSSFFSGDVATKFMQQASQHATNLASDTDSMIGTAEELDNVRRYVKQKIEEQSK